MSDPRYWANLTVGMLAHKLDWGVVHQVVAEVAARILQEEHRQSSTHLPCLSATELVSFLDTRDAFDQFVVTAGDLRELLRSVMTPRSSVGHDAESANGR